MSLAHDLFGVDRFLGCMVQERSPVDWGRFAVLSDLFLHAKQVHMRRQGRIPPKKRLKIHESHLEIYACVFCLCAEKKVSVCVYMLISIIVCTYIHVCMSYMCTCFAHMSMASCNHAENKLTWVSHIPHARFRWLERKRPYPCVSGSGKAAHDLQLQPSN